MATSDELLEAIEKIAVDYESSPHDDGLPNKPNFHYSLLELLQAIEFNQRVYNEMYKIKNGLQDDN